MYNLITPHSFTFTIQAFRYWRLLLLLVIPSLYAATIPTNQVRTPSFYQPPVPFPIQQHSANTANNNTVNSQPQPLSACGQHRQQENHTLLLPQAFFDPNQPIFIEADSAQGLHKNQIDFLGDVFIHNAVQQLRAQEARYLQKEQTFFVQKNVRFIRKDIKVQGKRAWYHRKTQQGQIESVSYQLPLRPAQGKADQLLFSAHQIDLTAPTYSTCPAMAEDWSIQAKSMRLFTDKGYGEGRDVAFYFKNIPIFYTPYLKFPLNDQRQSGFLMPGLGYSSKRGADISTPYYLNIAPNADATLTPRLLTRRGVMLGGELRYLGARQYGQVYAEYLSDQRYDISRNNAEVAQRGTLNSRHRGALSLFHQAQITTNWRSLVNFNAVSDNYYIDDFGNNLKDRSVNHLLREARLEYQHSGIQFRARLQGYQELRLHTNTYSRLPQLQLNLKKRWGLLGAGLQAEAVSFVKNWQYDNVANEGQRYYLRPFMEIPLQKTYGFIKPRFSLDTLGYQLQQNLPGYAHNKQRVLPVFSLDSGLFFERDWQLGTEDFVHTLEPRLFYLYVPYRDQNDQPVFDTSTNTFGFNQLFRENRFSGVDRLGDANQLSLALTSRLYSGHSGVEWLHASIGEILYFRDRQVQLNAGQLPQTTATSAIAAELAGNVGVNWHTRLSLLYDPHQQQMDNTALRLQYKSDTDHIANLGYSYKSDGSARENYEQLDLSAYWQVAPRWHGFARWNQSLKEHFNLESLLGLEYESCCYALRLAISREQAYITDEPDYRAMIQFHFKGLASLGNISDRRLLQEIRGFDATMTEK